MASSKKNMGILAVALVLVSFGPSRVVADCELLSTIAPTHVYNQGGILRTDKDRCCSDARASAIEKFENTVNLLSKYTSSAKSDAKKISAAYNGATGTGSGSYGESNSEGTVEVDTFKGITWLAVVENCKCKNLKEKSGDDCSKLDPTCGKKANGYCIADVKCKLRYYSPMLDADCKKYLGETDEDTETESNSDTIPDIDQILSG